jgi:SAM-dependent methyltransferase
VSRTSLDDAATKHLVASAYDEAAVGFAETADRVVYRYLAAAILDKVGSVAGTVLDVAAGTGAAGGAFGDVVALDLSMGQLRRNAVANRVRADAERLPFRDDAFAAAVCTFGINHFPNAVAAVREMARVAPVVSVATWVRPEQPHAPKQIVFDTLIRHAGHSRSRLGAVVDELGSRVGSVEAVDDLLRTAGLRGETEMRTVVVPWPGIDLFLDYRLSMASTASLASEQLIVRREAAAALAALPASALDWPVQVVVGLGRRSR